MASYSNQTSVSRPMDDKFWLKEELPEPFCWKAKNPGDAHFLGIISAEIPSGDQNRKHLDAYLVSRWGNEKHYYVAGPTVLPPRAFYLVLSLNDDTNTVANFVNKWYRRPRTRAWFFMTSEDTSASIPRR